MTGNNVKSELSARTESKNAPLSSSRFDLSYHNYLTPSYGRITPFLKLEGVAGDDLSIRTSNKIRSYTLKSPLMSDVYMQKDFFSVPMQAILPINWDKIFTNPVVGDDVDAESCNCLLNPSDIYFANYPNLICSSLEAGAGWNPHIALNYLFLCEKFLSKGSLFSIFGINLWSCLQFGGGVSTFTDTKLGVNLTVPQNGDFDDFEDAILKWFRAYCLSNDSPISVSYIELDPSQTEEFITKTTQFQPSYAGDTSYFEDFLDFCREHYLTAFSKTGVESIFTFNLASIAYSGVSQKLNISCIAAYQIVCAHYFTNDRIDYIYSADLYRQMMTYLAANYSRFSFQYNGVETFYDALSYSHIHNAMYIISDGTVDKNFYKSWYYIVNLLGFNNSLRFSDYFTGARLHPLAVGSTDISVNKNLVSVIDVTRNIQIQRFLNLVNKTGRKVEEYTAKLFGTYMQPDYHNPSYLGKVRDKVVSYETENTSDAQQSKPVSVTSTFNNTSSNFAFEFHCDRPSIILGVMSFDIPRVYSRIIERDALHYDRFDYFNPFMQFIGDQQISRVEISPSVGTSASEPWGYQSRYAEYKTRVPICSGGFSKQNVLPSWQFVADMDMNSDISANISPSYIRSRRSELDKFYLALTGESPATRFHFIIDMHNNIDAKRPMVANPNIL